MTLNHLIVKKKKRNKTIKALILRCGDVIGLGGNVKKHTKTALKTFI